jgi:predicted O-methyltransferase YrrM
MEEGGMEPDAPKRTVRRRRSGRVDEVRRELRETGRRALERTFRGQLQPPLGTLARGVAVHSTAEDDLLRFLFPGEDLARFEQELTPLGLGAVGEETDRRAPGQAYPSIVVMGRTHLRLIYKALRLQRPERVVETGVADGRSSRTILSALAANHTGQLTSFDVAEDVGSLVEPTLRSRWELVVLPASGRREALEGRLATVAPFDVFLHDSDHSYAWQSFEYRIGFAGLRPGGLLLSDDIDGSFAFLDFVDQRRLAALACVGSLKVMGVVRKPGARPDPAPHGD